MDMVAELYRSYRRKLKQDPEYDLWKCEYLFGGRKVVKVTKRIDYFIHTTDNEQHKKGYNNGFGGKVYSV